MSVKEELKEYDNPELAVQDAEFTEAEAATEATAPIEIKRPYILCMMVRPDGPAIADRKDTEGLKINMMPDGGLDPESVRDFIMEANIVALDDKRTHVMTARLRNNFIITEAVSATSVENVNEEEARQILIGRIFSKVHDYMMFLLMTASVSDNKILADYNAVGQVPVDVKAALGEA